MPREESDFEQIRDSFYILSMMNQFSINQTMPRVEAERLLRIALFSDSLQLEVVEDDTRNLVKRRRKLARNLREGRKKSVVPVFISLMWFLFSLLTSIQQGRFCSVAKSFLTNHCQHMVKLVLMPQHII